MKHFPRREPRVTIQVDFGVGKREVTLLIIEDLYQYLIDTGVKAEYMGKVIQSFFEEEVAPEIDEAIQALEDFADITSDYTGMKSHIPGIHWTQEFVRNSDKDDMKMSVIISPNIDHPRQKYIAYFMRAESTDHFLGQGMNNILQ